MPRLTINGESHDVSHGQRLVLAIETSGTKIGHRCGGNARCTTCRVEFAAGEPEKMTRAEYQRLTDRGLLGQVRLSCQIVCDHDMSVKPVMTVENQPQWNGDNGPAPQPAVQPEARWYTQDELKKVVAAEGSPT